MKTELCSLLLITAKLAQQSAAEPTYILSDGPLCPTGGSVIETKEVCRQAASRLDLRHVEPEDDDRQHFPRGCYKGADSRLFFNLGGAESDTAASTVARAVCKWQGVQEEDPTSAPQPEDEQLGYLGSCLPNNALDMDYKLIPELDTRVDSSSVPPEFDARKQWGFCFDGLKDAGVRAQGSCGSCWVFATTSVARVRACIYDCAAKWNCNSNNTLHTRQLSVQHVMTCGESRAGCGGGLAVQAYKAMQESVVWSDTAPYACKDGSTEDQFNGQANANKNCLMWPWGGNSDACAKSEIAAVKISGYYRLSSQEGKHFHDIMAAELVVNGPLAVDFCVRDNFFSFWSGVDGKTKIYTDADGCKNGRIIGGHMAMLIGFGVGSQDGRQVPYWLLQNSWSSGWADNGHFRMERGVNLCGLENKATFPNATTLTDEETTTKSPGLQEENDDDDGISWVLLCVILLTLLAILMCAAIAAYVYWGKRPEGVTLTENTGGCHWQPPVQVVGKDDAL